MQKRILAAVTLVVAAIAPVMTATAQQCVNITVSQQDLAAGFQCNMALSQATRAPVILLPATALTPEDQLSWNYVPALTAKGWPVCTVTVPNFALGDAQIYSEYVKYAVNTAYASSGRKVQLVGFSQGGMIPRWSFKFSPTTRSQIEDFVSVSPPNHGSTLANALCFPGTPDLNLVVGCEAALWQQRIGSHFLEVLNSPSETFSEVNYTNAYSVTDDVVTNLGPNPSAPLMEGGSNLVNIKLQDICPLNVANHTISITYDPVAYAIVLDALEHEGIANVARIKQTNPGLCLKLVLPGVNPLTATAKAAVVDAQVFARLGTATHLSEEPPLACYAY